MSPKNRKGFLRAFWDFLVIFIGISTASNLSRTRRRPVEHRGFFLFRKTGNVNFDDSREDNSSDHRNPSEPRR